MKKVVIWGSGGHAREVNHLCEALAYEVVGFLDERPEMKGIMVDDLPILGDINDITSLKKEASIICAGVGDPALKKKFVLKTQKAGFQLANSIIHPSVYISKRNKVGIGSIICEGSIITTNVTIGNFVIVNRSVNLSHDDCIDDYVTISPGVTVAGNVTIGEGTYIGIGSSIREKITIGSWSIVGGGAFVKDHIPDYKLYAGVPAVCKKDLV